MDEVSAFIIVAENEGDQGVEFQLKSEGLLLSDLQSKFPDAIGLGYGNSKTNKISEVPLLNGYLHPPDPSQKYFFIMKKATWCSKFFQFFRSSQENEKETGGVIGSVKVAENEGDEGVEFPCGTDGSLLLSTLQYQFPNATGLRYRSPETQNLCAVTFKNGRLYPPNSSKKYICIMKKAAPPVEQSSFEVEMTATEVIDRKNLVNGMPTKTIERTYKVSRNENGTQSVNEIQQSLEN